ncbi:anti-sigma factor family protein [Mycolicibacterium mengxianglii]|uniref:anti-sigma factor family protein n=1 Tax=Mycolicibacterium mengxianglii TaxID=2736649 RepID=UPI0018D1C3D5|nr:zf-HC2 domain-containing protein [Mycolicibacterium mengxianglii]
MTTGCSAGGSDAAGPPYEQWDAAYVLGALSSDERREYESHLTGCASCRRAVSELAGMPALLALLDGGTVTDEVAGDGPPLLRSLLATVTRRRRRVRWAAAVASAAAVLLAVALVVVSLQPTSAPVPETTAAPLELVAVAPSSYRASITVTDHQWGTGIAMACHYADWEGASSTDHDVDRLAMVAVGHDGSRTRLATWLAVTGTMALPQASTSMARDEIAAVQVVSADNDEVLLERSLSG